MQVIDVDGHITVTKGHVGTSFHVEILPDGRNTFDSTASGRRPSAPPQR